MVEKVESMNRNPTTGQPLGYQERFMLYSLMRLQEGCDASSREAVRLIQ